ncbi:hypothetical protein DXG03_005428 [Asterophora parasitica]|uniref:Sm protein B n=1 Tax=Asterophora parasitica TaxID=117018 RepID=A0A9P7GEW1_9AGAR|nr:hypothetical protein DXG03_005428 [Asterophora parasitica]
MPPPKSKGGKMLSLVNWRLKVTINDGRALTGQMLAFDRHMNLVLADCEEFRRVRPKKKAGEESAPEQEIKRTLGLVILRGETVVSLSVEGPPPVVDDDKKNAWDLHPFSAHQCRLRLQACQALLPDSGHLVSPRVSLLPLPQALADLLRGE